MLAAALADRLPRPARCPRRVDLGGDLVLAHRRRAGCFQGRGYGQQAIERVALPGLGGQELHDAVHLGHLLRRQRADL
ncbi:MAG: hypothetical protein J0M20_03770 [Burkholderiales bacterium]|nr:hypothetical protein [Burkholderiales bacterium]